MKVLPPGTILQLIYLRERLKKITPGHFIEIGPGSGEITQVLLDLGWTGQSYDLDAITIERLKNRFSSEVHKNLYQAINADYLKVSQLTNKADLVISCMVMEHLDDQLESKLIQNSSKFLNHDGLMIGIVPGSPNHWGIEDEIAGHCRRYTRNDIRSLMLKNNWKVEQLAGLTFPISNLLLPISNFLVRRNESSKLTLPEIEKTKFSGRRSVKFKTHFPSLLGLILNPYVLFPLHLLQKVFKGSRKALVLYFEARPKSQF